MCRFFKVSETVTKGELLFFAMKVNNCVMNTLNDGIMGVTDVIIGEKPARWRADTEVCVFAFRCWCSCVHCRMRTHLCFSGVHGAFLGGGQRKRRV